MKNIFWIVIIIVSVSITGVCQGIPTTKKNESGLFEPYDTGKCSENSDSLYNRQKTLEQLAEILNVSVFGTKKDDFVFGVKNERPSRFTIYDLTEPPNKGTSLSKCVNFSKSHVYHFSPIQKRYSFSHIVVLEDGNLKVFKSINCKGKGDSLEDVINYVSPKLKDNKNKDEILNRVKNYRKYGIYTTVDTPNLQCE